jgi:paired amphipathic helix protein Sin3a
MDRDRELQELQENREREIMQAHAAQNAAAHQEDMNRVSEQRDRELRERLQHEQAAHENHSAPIQIHQPVAVAPSTRTIHGPNGLLGQSGPLGGPPTITGPSAPNNIFGGASIPTIQQGETTPRMQHAVQPPSQASMLMPFTGPQGQMAMGQGQQPILNVSNAISYVAIS